jgi:hypothetical protein
MGSSLGLRRSGPEDDHSHLVPKLDWAELYLCFSCPYVMDNFFAVTNVATVRDFDVDRTLHTGMIENFVCVGSSYFRKMK